MVTLTEADIHFFKTNGYLIKREVLDPDLMARARARLWDGKPPSFDPDDPDTWVGPIKPEEENDDRVNHRRNFRWQFRETGRDEFMIDMLPRNPSVRAMVEQFLGPELREPQGIRGIYSTLPYGDRERADRPPGCHVDAHPFYLGVVSYIDFVPPGGGGFTVWPKSHRTFFNDFYSRHSYEPTGAYQNDRDWFSEHGEFADCHGGPGDIVFWHHRIGHTASPNHSRQIRKAVLYDFSRSNLPYVQEEPPVDDMWRDWSDAVRNVEIDSL
ncbi:MAG: hypothetical protein ACI8V2_001073 [Candidatus Latescibacterota bacterium]|jgi:hypothetical protein